MELAYAVAGAQRPGPASDPPAPRWGGASVMVRNGTLDELAASVPGFARRPFALGDAGGPAHPRFDMIVREARPDGGGRVPVGVVSKGYRLVQHGDLIRALQQALSANGIGPPEATEVGDVLRRGITLARAEQASLRAWLATLVSRDDLARWVDGPVRRSLGGEGRRPRLAHLRHGT